jgi:hypothetical protein
MQHAPQGLSSKRGGNLLTKTDATGLERPLSATYEASALFDDHGESLVVGGSGTAKIHVGHQTIGHRLWRAFCQTFEFELVLRRGAEDGALAPSAVFSRWQADSLPALGVPGAPTEGARWRLALLRCRGDIQGTGSRAWTVDWRDATRDLSLVSGAGRRPAAARAGELLAG